MKREDNMKYKNTWLNEYILINKKGNEDFNKIQTIALGKKNIP